MKWETHCHTAEGSACGRCSGAEMARACRAAGYDGLFITDHFYHGNTAPDRSLPWAEWVRQFCMGFRNAHAEGEKIGLRVLFGWEYSWEGADFLTYGLSPEWLTAHPETVTVTPVEYLRLVRKAGGLVVHAHPFREAHYIRYFKLLPYDVDAVEMWNAANMTCEMNDRALWYAKSYHLPMTAGSDAHATDQFAAGISTADDIRTAGDYKVAVLKGRCSCFTDIRKE